MKDVLTVGRAAIITCQRRSNLSSKCLLDLYLLALPHPYSYAACVIGIVQLLDGERATDTVSCTA